MPSQTLHLTEAAADSSGIGSMPPERGGAAELDRSAAEGAGRRQMGVHGIEAFENDAAWDWFAKLAAEGSDLIPAALLAVADRPDAEIGMEQYSRAVAAALVAAAINAEAPPLYQDQMDWLTRSGYHPAAGTVALAWRAIRTILGESEMKSLVMRSPHSGQWTAYMARLESSLRQPVR